MDFYEEASLVMVPSGYKDQKVYSSVPDDGSADLTFSRASNATRVNSEGLVEKVRTNQLLQSNSFDTTWSNYNSSETGGQSGYDGTSDAWLINKSGADGNIDQTISINGVCTFSVYAKKGTDNWIQIRIGTPTLHEAFFDLENGVIGTESNLISSSIESAGNGYYRCSITANVSSVSYVRIYVADADNDTTGTSGNIYIQDAQLETGDIATDYIATTSAAVSVGPVSGLPRLNYDAANPTSASLLLEPQRTNLALYSEQFDNAAYVKANISVTANATTSPDGYVNADKIESTAAPAATLELRQALTLTAQSYVASVYLKQGSGSTDLNNFDIYNAGGSYQARTSLNFATGVLTQSIGTGASVVNVGNGWFRVLVPFTGYAGTNYFYIGNSGTYEASGKYVYAYGFSVEAGAYATSYIPTLSTAVTRVADAVSDSTFTALPNANFTIFFEVDEWSGSEGNNYQFRFIPSSGARSIQFRNRPEGWRWLIVNDAGGSAYLNSPSYTFTKMACRYDGTNYQLFADGSAVGTPFAASDSLILTNLDYFGIGTMGVKQMLCFSSALSDADCETLTTL